jgi:DNA replication protein DnaC
VGADGDFARAVVCTCVPPCARCGDTGSVAVEREGGVATGRCRCRTVHDRVLLFNRAEVPARHAGSTFPSFDPSAGGVQAAYYLALTWAERFDAHAEQRGKVFWGEVGRGKTHLLAAALRHLVFSHGVEARFIEFSRLLAKLKEGYGERRSDAPVLGELSRVPVLGIDELGKGRLTDWELAVIDEVVSRRYNALRCTLATTNYEPGPPTGTPPPNLAEPPERQQTLGDRVGARVWSRLVHMCDFVALKGEDYRAAAGRHGP